MIHFSEILEVLAGTFGLGIVFTLLVQYWLRSKFPSKS